MAESAAAAGRSEASDLCRGEAQYFDRARSRLHPGITLPTHRDSYCRYTMGTDRATLNPERPNSILTIVACCWVLVREQKCSGTCAIHDGCRGIIYRGGRAVQIICFLFPKIRNHQLPSVGQLRHDETAIESSGHRFELSFIVSLRCGQT